MERVSSSKLDDNGREVLDDTPVSLPVRFKRTENLVEQVQRMVDTRLSQMAEDNGFESFEEADDFYVEDVDFEPRTRYELDAEAEMYDHKVHMSPELKEKEENVGRNIERLVERARDARRSSERADGDQERGGETNERRKKSDKRDKRTDRVDEDR